MIGMLIRAVKVLGVVAFIVLVPQIVGNLCEPKLSFWARYFIGLLQTLVGGAVVAIVGFLLYYVGCYIVGGKEVFNNKQEL